MKGEKNKELRVLTKSMVSDKLQQRNEEKGGWKGVNELIKSIDVISDLRTS